MRLKGFYKMIKKLSVIFILASKGHQETSEGCYFYMSPLMPFPTVVSTLSMVNPQISIVKVAKVGVLPHELRK